MTAEDAYTRLTDSCSKKEMCRQDVYKWMFKFNVPKESQDDIVKKLTENNFIDEQRYACAFANDSLRYSKWGKIKIAYQLRCKQIPENFIENALAQLDENLYEEIRKNLEEAKGKTIPDDDIQKEQKIKAYMYSRGF